MLRRGIQVGRVVAGWLGEGRDFGLSYTKIPSAIKLNASMNISRSSPTFAVPRDNLRASSFMSALAARLAQSLLARSRAKLLCLICLGAFSMLVSRAAQAQNNPANAGKANAESVVVADAGKLFRERIAPILTARCQACHGSKTEGGYSVATPRKFLTAGDSEAVPVVPSKLDESELWRRLISKDDSERMPVDAEPLSAVQLAAVKAWIEAGAPIEETDLGRAMAELTIAPRIAAPEHYPRPLAVHALALHRGADELIVGGYAEVTRWSVRTDELLARIPVAGPHVGSLAVSSDRKQMVVSSGSPSQRGVIELMQLPELSLPELGLPRQQWPGQQLPHAALPATADVAPHLALSPDGMRVAIGGSDGSLRIAEILSDHRFGDLQIQTPHADAILAVAWSDNGERLLTASRDRTAKLFDTKSLELIASYDRHERAVGGVGFFGKRSLSFDETGRLRMMAGDDSDGIVAEQSGLPRVLQQIVATKDQIFIADRSRLRRFRIEKTTVDNGTSEDGKPKTKEVTRFREQSALEIAAGQWITSVAVNESAIAVGTQQGLVTVWDRSKEEQIKVLRVTP